MSLRHAILFLGILIVSFLSCKNESVKSSVKPNPTGRAGEIVVIAPDNLWKGKVGDTVFFTMSRPFPVLPQDEAFFKLSHITPSAFTSIFKTGRNLLFINIGKDYKEAKVERSRDEWANLQLIYRIYAPDTATFFALWDKNKEKIVNDFFDMELYRFQQAYLQKLNAQAIDTLAAKYHIYLQLPSSYSLDVQKKHFAWMSYETSISSQGIFFYDYPYVDTLQFSVDSIISRRDSVTKKNVPGPDPGTYMQTETRIPYHVEKMNIDGHYCVVVRGLWRLENYFMGGPFVSYTVLDENRNRIVTVEAYVYAGKQDKKLYMWQTEAIVRTLKILDK